MGPETPGPSPEELNAAHAEVARKYVDHAAAQYEGATSSGNTQEANAIRDRADQNIAQMPDAQRYAEERSDALDWAELQKKDPNLASEYIQATGERIQAVRDNSGPPWTAEVTSRWSRANANLYRFALENPRPGVIRVITREKAPDIAVRLGWLPRSESPPVVNPAVETPGPPPAEASAPAAPGTADTAQPGSPAEVPASGTAGEIPLEDTDGNLQAKISDAKLRGLTALSQVLEEQLEDRRREGENRPPKLTEEERVKQERQRVVGEISDKVAKGWGGFLKESSWIPVEAKRLATQALAEATAEDLLDAKDKGLNPALKNLNPYDMQNGIARIGSEYARLVFPDMDHVRNFRNRVNSPTQAGCLLLNAAVRSFALEDGVLVGRYLGYAADNLNRINCDLTRVFPRTLDTMLRIYREHGRQADARGLVSVTGVESNPRWY